jgi:PAS domain S-box-containing protein
MGAALAGQPVVIEDAERDPRVRREETRAVGVRSLGIVPMRAHGEVVGVIAVGSFAPQRFGTAELGLLQAVADQIGLWTENRRLLARSRQREQDARFLADLGDELNRARDVSRVVRLLTRKAGGALGRASLVLLRDAETGEWEVAHIYHPSRAQRDRIAALMAAHPPRASGGLTDLASRSAGPMLLDVANAGLPDNLTLRLRQIGVTSIVFAPLRMGDRMLGMFISAAASGMPPLTERHRLLAAEISRHASVALANAIARRELLARNRELALMNRVTSVAQRATTAAGLCADIIRCLHRAFPGRGAVLRTWDAEAGVLRLAAAAGFSDEIVAELAEHPPRLGERLAGHVAATREPKLTQSLTADPRLAFDGPVIPTFRALMAAPLLIEGRLVGTVSMVSDHAGAFTASHLRLLSSVAGPLAAAMARLAAYERAEGAGRYSRALIDNAADAVFVVDPRTHRVVDTNPAAERLTGYSRTELLALCDQELRPPAEREQPSSSDLAVRHGRFTNRRPALVRRKDGTDVPIEVSASMVDSPAGLVALNIVRDITERTAGEARLRFQSQVLAAMRDAVVATDLSRRAVFWNEGATQLYGWTAEEMLGQPLDRLVPPGEEVSHEENFRRAASGEVWQAERQRLRKDGTLIWCDMRFSPLFDDRGEVSGVLAVLRDVTDRRQAEEAIGRARDEAARRAAEFAATAEASRAVVGGGSPHTQLQRLTTHIGHVTAFDAVLVVVYDHHADEVRFESAFHRPEHPPAALLGRIGERRPGWQSVEFQRLIAMRAPEVVEDVASAPPEVVAKDHWARTDRFRTLVRVPLYYNGRAEGCFLLASRRLVPVTGDDLHLYQTLADPVSVAVHNLIEYDRALEMRRDAIFRLATACEARDPETMPHLLQMQHLTASLARELGMTEEEVEDHSLSSVLHDAGKIRTPDTILWKPGKLGPEEMVIVRLHAAHGEQLLAGPEFYATARSVARHHHERWDGSGYPDGLAGDDIPLAARIAAVADVFDSMTSRRVYRPAWPAERAADEIIAHAGRMFDPRVVEAFASLLRSDRLPVRPSARV